MAFQSLPFIAVLFAGYDAAKVMLPMLSQDMFSCLWMMATSSMFVDNSGVVQNVDQIAYLEIFSYTTACSMLLPDSMVPLYLGYDSIALFSGTS